MREEARKRILERRAVFLAAAVSSAAGCGPCNPMVCLEPAIAPAHDTGTFDSALPDAALDASGETEAAAEDAVSPDATADTRKD